MGNMIELAWTKSFDMIVLGVLCLLVSGIRLLRKHPVKKSKIAILLVVMAYFIYSGLPFARDYIEADVYSVQGVVEAKNSRTSKFSRTVYSYTIANADGNELVLYVDEGYDGMYNMEIGSLYDVSYYKHSRAISSVEPLP